MSTYGPKSVATKLNHELGEKFNVTLDTFVVLLCISEYFEELLGNLKYF